MPGVEVILSDSLQLRKKMTKRELPPTCRARKPPATFVIRPINVVSCYFLKFHQANLRELYRKCSALYWDFIVIPLFVSTVC